MERTLEIMEEELKLVREQLKPLSNRIRELENEIEDYKLNNELYHPMSELINYIGKNIDSIILVERNKDGTLSTEYMYCDEIFEVDEYGQLYFSSYSDGIIRYDNDNHKYVHKYYGSSTYHDYVGYLEINISKY
jgi:hypothetical protein